MCDYSLMSLPNRLAVCGDELVVYRFELGTLGLASAAEALRQANQQKIDPDLSFIQRLKKWFYPPVPMQCTAVCVPPGARLLMRDVPARMQRLLCLHSPVQEVTFTQIDTAGFRDAVRFENGEEVLLQRLTEGQRVRVITLAAEEPRVASTPRTTVLSAAGL